jgi:uncharacterized protein (TIGR00369 family)
VAEHRTTVTWHDPQEVLPQLLELDGLGYVEAVRDGELPPDPLMEAMGIRVVEVEAGRIVMTCRPAGPHLNLGGIVHGGVLSTLMDCATGFSVHSTLPAMHTAPHVSAAYQFLRVGHAGVELRCEGRVLRRGRTLSHARAEIHDTDGRLLATGETTHGVLDVSGGTTMRSGPSA